MEDVWLLQNVFRILQSDLAVAGRGEGKGRRLGNRRRSKRRQEPTRDSEHPLSNLASRVGRGLVYAPRTVLHIL